MPLPRQSIEKLFRDHFPDGEGMHVAKGERKALIAELQRRFEGDEWEASTVYSWTRDKKSGHYLHTFTLKEGEHYYSAVPFLLELDTRNRLLIRAHYHEATAHVASLDQIDSFVLDCRQRVERRRALKARREKVSGFKNAAMESRLKKLARDEKFDFFAEFTAQRVKIWIRVSGEDTIQLHFPTKRFQEILPRLSGVVRALRESFEAGVSFQVGTRRGLPWGAEWIRHQD